MENNKDYKTTLFNNFGRLILEQYFLIAHRISAEGKTDKNIEEYCCTILLVETLLNFLECFTETAVRRSLAKYVLFENFFILTEKHLGWSLFFSKVAGLQLYWKEIPMQVSFCENCKIFKNISFYRAPSVAASKNNYLNSGERRPRRK